MKMDDWLSLISPCPSLRPSGFAVRSLCGHMQLEAGWVEPRRLIYDHEVILVHSGAFEIEIDGTAHTCTDNSYLIIPPGRWHTTNCLRPGKRYYAHFDWEHWPIPDETPVMTFYPAAPRREFFRPAPKVVPAGILSGSIHAPAQVYALMDRLELMLGGPHPHEHCAARGVLLELLIRLLDPRPDPVRTGHHREELAYRVRMTLDRLISTPREDSAVCAELGRMGYSYEHLARVFRQQYGVSPVGYLHGMRIERAKTLLRHSDLKVAAVAGKVGYQDTVYFSRLFKRHTGTTPARFRQE